MIIYTFLSYNIFEFHPRNQIFVTFKLVNIILLNHFIKLFIVSRMLIHLIIHFKSKLRFNFLFSYFLMLINYLLSNYFLLF